MDRDEAINKLYNAFSYDLSPSSKKLINTAKLNQSQFGLNPLDSLERERRNRLLGQIKSAEATTRLRLMKFIYERTKEQGVDFLVKSQSSACEALRLEAILTPKKEEKVFELGEIEKKRLRKIIDGSLDDLKF